MFSAAAALGVWQVERLQWKEGLLAQIDHAEASAPVPLGPDPAPFSKVIVRGRLLADPAAHYGVEVRNGVLGSQLVVPLERDGADPVLVDRGWMPDGAPVPPAPDPAEITGYVRPPDPGNWFTPRPDLQTRRFFALDPRTVSTALGLPRVAPFTVVALGPTGAVPEPAQSLPRPPNNHLQYAITWFGLAAASLGIFAAYARKTYHR